MKGYFIFMDGEWIDGTQTKKAAIALIHEYRQKDMSLNRRFNYCIIKGKLIDVLDPPVKKSNDKPRERKEVF